MSDERFTLDTNILVYSVDAKAGVRHALAARLVDQAVERDCLLTLQAVSEFYAAATRKGIVPPADAAAQVMDWLDIFPCATASPSALRVAMASAAADRASFWDALLVATAAEAGCSIILTEDLSDGAALGDVRIINPFAKHGLAASTRRWLGLE